jgi:hypothetical protein
MLPQLGLPAALDMVWVAVLATDRRGPGLPLVPKSQSTGRSRQTTKRRRFR